MNAKDMQTARAVIQDVLVGRWANSYEMRLAVWTCFEVLLEALEEKKPPTPPELSAETAPCRNSLAVREEERPPNPPPSKRPKVSRYVNLLG